MSYPCQGIEELKTQVVYLATKEWDSWLISTGVKKLDKGGVLKGGLATLTNTAAFYLWAMSVYPGCAKCRKGKPAPQRVSWLPMMSPLYLFFPASLNKQTKAVTGKQSVRPQVVLSNFHLLLRRQYHHSLRPLRAYSGKDQGLENRTKVVPPVHWIKIQFCYWPTLGPRAAHNCPGPQFLKSTKAKGCFEN